MTRNLLAATGFSLAALASAGDEAFRRHVREVGEMPGVLRHWTFEEGAGEEASNHVDFAPGKRALTGGPRGSLAIEIENLWNYSPMRERYVRKDEQASAWVDGCRPGKSALRVGTLMENVRGSGLAWRDFTNGLTFAFRFRLPICATNLARANVWSLGQSSRLQFTAAYAQGNGRSNVNLSFGGTDAAGRRAFNLGAVVENGVWHEAAAVLGATNAFLYIDGKVVSQSPFTGPAKSADSVQDGGYVCSRPFFESESPARFLRLGFDYLHFQKPAVRLPCDIDEFIAFGRPLSVAELARCLSVGAVPADAAAQRAAYDAAEARRAAVKAVTLAVPTETHGYYRIDEGMPLVAAVPADAPFEGPLTLDVACTTVGGAPVKAWSRTLAKGETLTVTNRFPACGCYTFDVRLADAKGGLVKALPKWFSVGVCPPRPARVDSVVGFWENHCRFSYDTNIRRATAGTWWHWVTMAWTNGQQVADRDLKQFIMSVAFPVTHEKRLPEERLARFRAKCRENAAFIAANGGAWGMEVTSEVDGRCSPESYVDCLRIAVEEYRKAMPGLLVFPPGGTPCSLPFIDRILKLGAAEISDGVSHHNYLSNPVWLYRWRNPGRELAAICRRHEKPGRKLKMYNTESGAFTLPRVYGRPMTRDHARNLGYPVNMDGGYESYNTSMPTLPERDAACNQVHAIFANLGSGYEIYTKCQASLGFPNEEDVALTALSGQVLNGLRGIREVPLPSLNSLCFFLDRTPEAPHGKTALALFGMEKMTFSFRAEPSKTYRTMDLFGNFGTVASDRDGILTLASSMEPLYVFGLPESLKAVTALSLKLPGEMPDTGRMEGALVVENPHAHALKGTLEARQIPGAQIALAETAVSLAPGARREIGLAVTGTALKRRVYPVRVELAREGRTFSTAEATFVSPGLVHVVPRAARPMPLDGDRAKWEGTPALVCDTVDDVVHGQPNLAEQWIPQWVNRDDLSLRLRTAWSAEGVHFLLEVTDDTVWVCSPEAIGNAFWRDCLELFVDVRASDQLGQPCDEGADQVLVRPNDGNRVEPLCRAYCRKAGGRDANWSDVDLVGARTATGYFIEGRIRPNAKSPFRLLPGSRLNMDFLVDDGDGEGTGRKSCMAVHGVFENNTRADTWGRYVLGK